MVTNRTISRAIQTLRKAMEVEDPDRRSASREPAVLHVATRCVGLSRGGCGASRPAPWGDLSGAGRRGWVEDTAEVPLVSADASSWSRG